MIEVTHIRQSKPTYCGPACLQVVLDYFGVKTTQSKLAKKSGTTFRSGTPNLGLVRTMRGLGFTVITRENSTTFSDIRKYVAGKKVPVIVDWFSSYEHPANGHYSVVVDINKTHISLYDPGVNKIRKIPLKEFIQLWFDFDGDIALDKLPVRVYFRWMMAAIPQKK